MIGGLKVKGATQALDFAGQPVDLHVELLLQNSPVGLFAAQGDVFLQHQVVLLAQQVDRALHLGQKVVVALAAADGPRYYSAEESAR